MPKKKETKTIIEKIYDYSLEEIMETGFGRYSKEIIQERALPDVRDGLKPVQRRILYAMYLSHFTHDKPYRKSAKAVGDIMGNFHPHGDSSIYDAMIRMSQPWKMRETFIDVHGNNGSIDGDGPAASRYTEARLSKIAEEMLTSISKNTVEMTYNYDDTQLEPTVLPAAFPNLLVNGSTGISAGYATNIPTHNLGEVIDATIKRIESPNCRLESILEVLPGPDFPTGGVVEGRMGLIDAYTKGKGKVVLKAKTEIVKNGKSQQIIVHSIPYEVVKEQLIKKITDIKLDKKIEGINDIIDESDYEHMARIVIDLKSNANAELLLNYLLKNTDLQVNYNFNMVAIVNRRPKLVGILEILDAFIAHQKEVVTRRTQFDLDHARLRYHILEGLKKAISILDEVIRVIRASKNKSDAMANLVKEFDFTEEQAKAIVELQLYRLTNTDIVELEEQMKELEKNINIWSQILTNEEALKHVMKTELRLVKKEYANPRRTEIKDEVTEIKIDKVDIIPKETVVVAVTKEGYCKRVSAKSYASRTDDDPTLKPGDYVIGLYEMSTLDTLLLFTNQGNYLFLPVHELPDLKWKELGKHVNNLVALEQEEEIVGSLPVSNFEGDQEIVMVSKEGMIKRSPLKEFKVTRYSKPITCMKLKANDEMFFSTLVTKQDLFLGTRNGYGLWFDVSEVPVVGLKTSGVKAINLKDDLLVSASLFDARKEEYVTILTTKGTGKRVKLLEFEKSSRARRGLLLFREVKTNPYSLLSAFVTDSRNHIGVKGKDITIFKLTELPIMDRYSSGSVLCKEELSSAFFVKELEKEAKEEEKVTPIPPKKEQVSLKEIDDRLMTIDDFLKD